MTPRAYDRLCRLVAALITLATLGLAAEITCIPIYFAVGMSTPKYLIVFALFLVVLARPMYRELSR